MKDIEIEISNAIDANWDQRMLDAAKGAFNQTSFFGKIYSNEFCQNAKCTYIKKDGELIGQYLYLSGWPIYWIVAFPFSRTLKNALKYPLYKSVSSFEAPVFFKEFNKKEKAELTLETIKTIVEHEKPMRKNFYLIDYSVDRKEIDLPIGKMKLNSEEKKTVVFDFENPQNYEELKKRKWTRYIINRSKKQELEFVEATEEKEIDDFFEVFIQTRKRNKISIHTDKEYFKLIWRLNKQYNYLKLFLIYEKNGKPLAAQWVSTFNGYMTEFGMSISDYARKNKIYANDFMQYCLLEYGKRNNMKILDLVGYFSNPKTKKENAINHFKRKWSSDTLEYQHIF